MSPQNKTKHKVTQGHTCACELCSPKSWDKISKHLDAKIARAQRARLSGSVIPGGCFPPHVIKQRYEEAREMHKRSIFKGF